MNSETLEHAFTTFLKEGVTWGVFFFLVTAYAVGRGTPAFRRPVLAGMLLGIAVAGFAGFTFLPQGTPGRELWVLGALCVTALLFGASMGVSAVPAGGLANHFLGFVFGLLFVFFDAGALGAALQDYMRTVSGNELSVAGAAGGGLVMGLLPFLVLDRWWRRVRWEGVWSPGTLLLAVGALGIVAGGVQDFAPQDLLVSVQMALTDFVGEAVRGLRKILLLSPHPYVATPGEGFFAYLEGDRVGLSLMVAAVFVPPAWLLLRIFADPDPDVDRLGVGAERRRELAFFRRDLFLRAAPAFGVFLVVVFQVHAANLSLNPLFDPSPVPVVADADNPVIKIPLSDRFGEFADGNLRRFQYDHGDKKIIFIALMKPDGTVKTCLDECEICEPAGWNTKAKGYAQRGGNLVCKYCVTPISIQSFGQPGGCNPIPFPSAVGGGFLYVKLDDLVQAWRDLEAMEKKGTHF